MNTTKTNIEREEGVTYILPVSGGKDSVSMADLLLKNGYPVDYLIFYDTLMEFGMMEEYIDKIKVYFKDRYNKELIITTPNTTFEEWCFGTVKDKNAGVYGQIRGIPMVWVNPCYWRRESKEKPANDFIKSQGIEKSVTYIGFTKGENRSVKNTENSKYIYPLKDTFHMTERDCQEYLLKQDMENPLYRDFTRTGCGMCPAQSEKAWYNVYKNHKETWEYMRWIEKRLAYYVSKGMDVQNAFWFTEHRTCDDMERMFEKHSKQTVMFDFSDEPLRDCFCKI